MTKQLITTGVEFVAKQIIAIIIMVVTSWEVVGMKEIKHKNQVIQMQVFEKRSLLLRPIGIC